MANFTAEVFRLEDTNENVSSYGNGNHNRSLPSKIIGNCNIQICFVHPNGLTNSGEILNLQLVVILQMKEKTKFQKIGPCPFNSLLCIFFSLSELTILK